MNQGSREAFEAFYEGHDPYDPKDKPFLEYSNYIGRRTKALARRRLARLRSSGRALEIGFGSHPQIELLRAAPGLEWFGIEFSRKQIRRAQCSDPGARFTLGSGGELPFPAGVFLAVMSFEVIEHVLDPEQMIAEIARVLARRPDALVIVSTPNNSALLNKTVLEGLYRVAGKFLGTTKSREYVATHQKIIDRHLSFPQFISLVQRNGLRLEAAHFLGACYFLVGGLAFFLPQWLFRPLAQCAMVVSRAIEHIPLLNRYLCNQAVYFLNKGDLTSGRDSHQ